jgi:hypothetical protein
MLHPQPLNLGIMRSQHIVAIRHGHSSEVG